MYIYFDTPIHTYKYVTERNKQKKNKTLDKDCNTTQLTDKLTYLKWEKLRVTIMDTIVNLIR